MTSPLKTLLDLRRDAEQSARLRLERAIGARVEAEAEQARLVEVQRVARAALLREERRRPRAPRTAAQAQGRERYREHLAQADVKAALRVEDQLRAALDPARGEEREAGARYEEARVALAAAIKLQEREAAAAAKRAERRAEDAAGDHAHAAFARRRS